MKKVKQTAEELFPEAFTVRNNILILSQMYGVSDSEIARAINKSPDTWARRKKEPWSITEYEKKMIAEILHTTVNALYTDIGKQINELMRQ